MALLHCPDCGHKVSDMANVCPGCGRPVSTITPPAPVQPSLAVPPPLKPGSRTCPKCKLLNPSTAVRCDCGYDFRSGQILKSYLPHTSFTPTEYQRVAQHHRRVFYLFLITLIYGIGIIVVVRVMAEEYAEQAGVIVWSAGFLIRAVLADAVHKLMTALKMKSTGYVVAALMLGWIGGLMAVWKTTRTLQADGYKVNLTGTSR